MAELNCSMPGGAGMPILNLPRAPCSGVLKNLRLTTKTGFEIQMLTQPPLTKAPANSGSALCLFLLKEHYFTGDGDIGHGAFRPVLGCSRM